MEESAGVTIVNMAHFNNVFESFKTIKLCRVSGVSSWPYSPGHKQRNEIKFNDSNKLQRKLI